MTGPGPPAASGPPAYEARPARTVSGAPYRTTATEVEIQW